jgi:hypothetical protein
LAEGCVRAHELALDDGEDIEVLTLPESEVPGLITSGAISHVLVAHAFHRLDLHRRGL